MKKLLIVTLLAMASFQAHAVLINTSIGTYNVTYTNTVGTSGILDDQPWWGSSARALEFANLVGNLLGFPNEVSGPDYGPFFAYANSGDDTGISAIRSGGGGASLYIVDEDDRWDYAIASRVETAVPEPTTISLLGAGLVGLALMRRRRTS